MNFSELSNSVSDLSQVVESIQQGGTATTNNLQDLGAAVVSLISVVAPDLSPTADVSQISTALVDMCSSGTAVDSITRRP